MSILGHLYCGQTVAHFSNCWALVITCLLSTVVFATSSEIWEVMVSSTLPSRTEIQLRPLSFCIQNLKKSKSICSKRCKICNKSVVAIIAIQMHQTRFKCESKTMFQIFARTFYLILTCILIHQLKLLVSFKFFTVNSAIRYKVCHRRLLLHCTRLRIKCRKPFDWCNLKTFLCWYYRLYDYIHSQLTVTLYRSTCVRRHPS